MDNLCSNINLLFAQTGKKPSELAEYLNVSRSLVSKWKNGRVIHPKWHESIASFFGITVDILYKKEEIYKHGILSFGKEERINIVKSIIDTL